VPHVISRTLITEEYISFVMLQLMLESIDVEMFNFCLVLGQSIMDQVFPGDWYGCLEVY